MTRLFHEHLYATQPKPRDADGFIRLDDLEMTADIQQKVASNWDKVTTENVSELTDIAGYREAFYQLFGFGLDSVDYAADVDTQVAEISFA
jgi:enoyl-[acyl-carrier protein] reductase/trans-2-enoyl-CoA reductase (NAD+)